MLVISPRSYVTAAFDLLFPELIKHVFRNLSSVKTCNWWTDIVYKQRDYIFGNAPDALKRFCDEYEQYNDPDTHYRLFDYFDEQTVCKLVKSHEARKYFNSNELIIYSEILSIRIEWAHRKYPQTELYDDEKAKREWADLAIRYLRDVSHYLKKPDIEKRISILLFKMKCDWIDENTEFPPYEELLKWLDNEVVSQVTADDSPVDELMKQRVQKSFDNLKIYTGKASERTASRYVVDYYWNAIRGKTDVYDAITENGKKKIPTFEDVVEAFTELCYGKGSNVYE